MARIFRIFPWLFLFGIPLYAQIDARMLRQPDVSRTQIAFVYAGDVWVAPKAGGVAQRLSSPKGEESFPRFSPDGSLLAFSGDYDGNIDIYVMAPGGGIPKRITHDPAEDRMLGWYPDGRSILFASGMQSGRDRFNQLYRVSRDGGLPEKLPVPYGEFGAISAEGEWLAYMPQTQDFRTWKYYRGGWAPDIWLFNLKTMAAQNITNNPANDSQPMWHGRTIYFLSDRGAEEHYNLWAYDLDSRKPRQVTKFAEDIHFPAIGPDDLVFEAGGRLYLMDLKNERYHEVPIQVVTDEATVRPELESVSDYIQNSGISPTGKRALFEARGDVFSVPEENGVILNLTRSPGAAERFPEWSPDGKSVAYWTDRSGEYELAVRAADGSGEEDKLTSLGAGFRYRPSWSPDSKKLAFIDQAMNIRIFDRDTRQIRDVDKGLWMFQDELDGFRATWSPDSRWLAWSRGVENRCQAVFLSTRATASAGRSPPAHSTRGRRRLIRKASTCTTWPAGHSSPITAIRTAPGSTPIPSASSRCRSAGMSLRPWRRAMTRKKESRSRKKERSPRKAEPRAHRAARRPRRLSRSIWTVSSSAPLCSLPRPATTATWRRLKERSPTYVGRAPERSRRRRAPLPTSISRNARKRS